MILAVAGVQAKSLKKVATSFSKGSNCSYESNVYTWTASDNGLWLFNNLNLDLTRYQNLHVAISNKTESAGWKVNICVENNYSTKSYSTTIFYSSTSTDINLTNITLSPSGTINRIEIVGVLPSGASSASFTINPSDIYLTGDHTDMYNTIGFDELTTAGSWTSTLVSLPVDVSSSLKLVGNDSGVSNYADISDYHAIIFKISDWSVTGGGKLRAFVCNESDGSFTTLYAHPISDTSVDNWSTEVTGPTANGYYYINISDYSRLVGIKVNNYATTSTWKIAEVYLVKSTLTLTDGYDLETVVEDPVGANVAYDRTFTVGQKSTICLPFALTADEVSAAGKFYELKSEADGKLTFAPVETTEAYKPYIFEATTATPFNNLTNKAIVASSAAETSYTVGEYTFKGVLAASSNVQGDNTGKPVYGFNGGNFVKVTDNDISIKAFRAYIVGPAAVGARGFLDTEFNDGTTGIQEINVQSEDAADAPAYNLAGQRVNANHKGIIIKGGKKYIVK